MLVYEGIKSGFIDDVNLNKIVDKIYDKYKQFFGRTSESQLNSWKNSMQYMRGVLDDREIPDNAGVAIEFNIPTTSKRIDFILSGRDDNKKDSVIIIELKQWETCDAVEGKDGIVSTFTGGGIREVTHPSYQAMSYANLIKDFNETVQLDEIGLYPCAFLHNYDLRDDDPICSSQYQDYIKEAPMFGT
ncbi:MAG: ATP-binding protein, partial [Firmicutes bacterium]|nr:ATP-binding protein [Bacillota bacterium]